MRAMRGRLKRLEARINTDNPANWSIDKPLLELASCLCSVPVLRLRELLDRHEPDRGRQVLSDQEELALAISLGEEAAYEAATKAGREAVEQGAKGIEKVYSRVFEEWQRIREARLARGAAVGRPVPWSFPDRSQWASPPEV